MTKQTTPSLKGSKVLHLQQLGPVRTAQCTQVFLILGTPAAAQEGQGCDYGVKALAVDYLLTFLNVFEIYIYLTNVAKQGYNELHLFVSHPLFSRCNLNFGVSSYIVKLIFVTSVSEQM